MTTGTELIIFFLGMLASYLIGHRFGEHSGISKVIDKFVEAKLVEEIQIEEEDDEL